MSPNWCLWGLKRGKWSWFLHLSWLFHEPTHHFVEINFDKMPTSFVKMDCKSIKPRSLICVHGPDNVYDFLLGDWPVESCVFLRVDERRDVGDEVSGFLIVAMSSFSVKIPKVGFGSSFDLVKAFETLPSAVLISAMWFLDSLALYCQWKNEVFWSPAFSHKLLDLSLQYSSSFLKDWCVDLWAFVSLSNNSAVISLLSISICRVCNEWTDSFLCSVGVGAGLFI